MLVRLSSLLFLLCSPIAASVNGVNNHAPTFSFESYNVAVRENTPIGIVIVNAEASDADQGENGRIAYTLHEQSNHFRIDSDTGRLFLTRLLDREQRSLFDLQVVATDNGIPSRQAEASVKIYVHDVNDNRPVFTQRHHLATIRADTRVGTTIVKVTATDKDADENGMVTYALSEPSRYVRVDPDSGFIILTQSVPSDVNQIDVNVRASDRGRPQLSRDASVTIDIAR